jgi:hypothetical protein
MDELPPIFQSTLAGGANYERIMTLGGIVYMNACHIEDGNAREQYVTPFNTLLKKFLETEGHTCYYDLELYPIVVQWCMERKCTQKRAEVFEIKP